MRLSTYAFALLTGSHLVFKMYVSLYTHPQAWPQFRKFWNKDDCTYYLLHVTQSAQSQQSYGLWTVLPLILNYVVSVIEEVPKYKNVPVCHFHALLNRLCSEKTWFGQRVSHLVSLYGRMNKKGQKSTTNKLTLIMVESYWCNNAILHTLILLHEKFL